MLLYADDCGLMSHNKADLEQLVQKWNDRPLQHGLRLNQNKAEFLTTDWMNRSCYRVVVKCKRNIDEVTFLVIDEPMNVLDGDQAYERELWLIVDESTSVSNGRRAKEKEVGR